MRNRLHWLWLLLCWRIRKFMYYNGPMDNEHKPAQPHLHKQPNRRKDPVHYGTEVRAKAMAIRDVIERELRVMGRVPTEDEARMLVLLNELIDGEVVDG
jgi:hypothetical protein